MEIIRRTRSKYSIIEHQGRYQLIKIVGKYESKSEAFSEMVKILQGVNLEWEVEDK